VTPKNAWMGKKNDFKGGAAGPRKKEKIRGCKTRKERKRGGKKTDRSINRKRTAKSGEKRETEANKT